MATLKFNGASILKFIGASSLKFIDVAAAPSSPDITNIANTDYGGGNWALTWKVRNTDSRGNVDAWSKFILSPIQGDPTFVSGDEKTNIAYNAETSTYSYSHNGTANSGYIYAKTEFVSDQGVFSVITTYYKENLAE